MPEKQRKKNRNNKKKTKSFLKTGQNGMAIDVNERRKHWGNAETNSKFQIDMINSTFMRLWVVSVYFLDICINNNNYSSVNTTCTCEKNSFHSVQFSWPGKMPFPWYVLCKWVLREGESHIVHPVTLHTQEEKKTSNTFYISFKICLNTS